MVSGGQACFKGCCLRASLAPSHGNRGTASLVARERSGLLLTPGLPPRHPESPNGFHSRQTKLHDLNLRMRLAAFIGGQGDCSAFEVGHRAHLQCQL